MLSRTLQSVNEKIGGADSTKLPEQYKKLEKKIDVANELVDEVSAKTKEYLQPNPANRARMKFSKWGGQSKAASNPYPQPEGTLGETLTKLAFKYGDDDSLSKALNDTGDGMKMMADQKNALENELRQKFLEPLAAFQSTDLKEVNHLKKDVTAKRLDFDSKRQKKRPNHVEVQLAEEQFHNMVKTAELAMNKVLANDVERISMLHAFAESLSSYHTQCAEIMKRLEARLSDLKSAAYDRRNPDFVPSQMPRLGLPDRVASSPSSGSSRFFDGESSEPPPPYTAPPNLARYARRNDSFSPRTPDAVQSQPRCRALYDFKKENDVELDLKEGDVITLIKDVDQEWFEGILKGKRGVFPKNYVQVIVPLS